jgi:hypothetical protein
MYRTMQYYYHFGLVLGIAGVGVIAYAFRCWREANTDAKLNREIIIKTIYICLILLQI